MNTSAAPSARPGQPPCVELRTESLYARYGNRLVVRNFSLRCASGAVTSIIGPSGCGKSTLLRCANRLHERDPRAGVTGQVFVGGTDVYAEGTNVIQLRSRVGMVFQRATPFPAMTVFENVAAGLVHEPIKGKPASRTEGVERALRRAGLWDEVCDRLDQSTLTLSGGQQQRLCIARALATNPQVLLLDEPTAALDPLSTQRIEELLYELRDSITIVLVTHNLQQAARVSDRTAFMLDGTLIETAETRAFFTRPADARTEAYLTGRFG